MTSFAAAHSVQTTDAEPKLKVKNDLSSEALRRRKYHRRQTLAAQIVGYLSNTIVIAFYAYSGLVTPMLAVGFLACGLLCTSFFLVLSEIEFNDRWGDHYLSFPQVLANMAVQIGFLVLAPEIGYIFLSCLLITFSFGSLRMSSQQSVIALSLMTTGVAPILLLSVKPIDLPASNQIERLAFTFCFVMTLVQCAFVGRFGSLLRNQLYKKTYALQAAYKRIEELAEIDELTGSFNRRSIMRMLDDEIARATRLNHPCSIALIDLDWFKRVNDTFGHQAGDEVLRTFAITTYANIRSIDLFGRYGGEEFLLVLPETPNDEAARTLNRLRLIVSDLDWSAFSPGLLLSVSAGVATLLPNEPAESFLARADAALYAAKRNGRNRIESAI